MAATPTQGTARLPVKDELGFFNIRLESIGGYGANIAGKMLAEAGVLYQGLNGANFSSYGSEKKGSPVKSFIRFAEPDTPIRISSPIEEPHIVCIFHEALIRTGRAAHAAGGGRPAPGRRGHRQHAQAAGGNPGGAGRR